MQKRGYSSPFRGKYLIRNQLANLCMYLVDGALSLFSLGTKRHFNIPRPKKILISDIAHLGDVVMMTSLLEPLKKALPDIEIGVLVGSWSEKMVKGHPLIGHIHLLDHWKNNRSSLSLWEKYKHYAQMQREAIEQIKKCHYDIAIECCYYFPNSAFLTYRSQIPIRIGYTSAGLGPLLSHPVQWTNRLQSAAEHFAALLSLVTPLDVSLLKPSLPPSASFPSLPAKSYLIIHMGSGNPIKEWPLEHWRKLSQKLVADGHTLAFTGKGKKEADAIAFVTSDLPHCLNLCDHLSVEEYVSWVRNAKMVIGVDTGVGHMAAATDTPSVLIYSGINPIEHWSPRGSQAHILMHPMPCYPCYLMKGCGAMECVRGVRVEQVYQKIQSLLASLCNQH